MNKIHAGILALCVLSACLPVQAQEKPAAVWIGSRTDVTIGGKFLTSYRFAADEKYPFFFILQHPQNPGYPAPWFTHEYGFLSPTPMFRSANGKDPRIAKGGKLRLCYRVLVFSGTAETAGVADGFTEFTSSIPATLD